MPRLDRVLRTIVLVPVFALGASLVTLLVAWILLHTSVGRDEIREFAEEQLQGQLGEGTATIGGADFDLWGQLSLSDIQIVLDGQVVISIRQLRVDLELFSFLRGELRIPKVHAVGPEVDARADLKRLVPPPEPDKQGGGLSVRVDEIEIDDGLLHTTEATVDQLNLAATVDADEHSVTIDDESSAHWVERDRTAKVSGTVREVQGAWVTQGATVSVAQVEVKLDWGLFEPLTGGVAVAGNVKGTAADILALGGEWLPPQAHKWRGDLDLGLTAVRGDRADGWEVSADGSAGTAQVAARGRIEGAEVRGRARAVGIEPAVLYEGAPVAALDAAVTLDDREATLVARGTVEGFEVDKLEARGEGTLKAGFVTADLTDRRGVIHTEARLRRFDDGTIQIDESHVHGDVTDVVERFVTQRMRRLKVDLHAVGPTTDLELFGDADVLEFREGEARVASAHIVVKVPHVSLKAKNQQHRGTLDVAARGLDLGGRRVGQVRAKGSFSNNGGHLEVDVAVRELGFADLARGDVVVDRDRRSTRIALGDVWVTTDTLTWKGAGGSVAIFASGRVDIDKVKLASPAGKLQVDGVLDAPRARRAEGTLVVKVEDLDLAAARPTLASVLKVDWSLEGTVRADIEVARRGSRLETAARADYAGVVWRPGAAAANGYVRGKLGQGKVIAQIEVKPRDDKGRVLFQVEANAPRDTMDVDAWRRLDLPDIDRSELKLEGIDSRVVESFAGDVLPYDGAVAGTVTFPHEGAQAFFIDIEVSHVNTPWLDDVGADVQWVWDGRALSGRAAVSHRGDDVITGTVGLDRGFQQLWRRPLQDFLTARVKADGEIRGFDLSRLERAGIVSERLAGQLDGDIDLTGTVERPRVVLSDGRGSNVRAAGIQIPQIKLGGDWEGKVVNGNVRAQQSAGGSIKLDAGYSWEREPSVTGRVKATSFDLKPLRVLAPDDTHPLADIAGRLDVELSVSGTTATPDVRGKASVRNLELLLQSGERRIDRGDVRLSFEGDSATVEQLQAYSGEGFIEGTGKLWFKDFEFALDVTSKQMPLVIGAYVAAIDAKGSFAGRWVDGWWEARAEVTEGTVWLADTGRELQSIGPLEDVIFVERIGGGRKGDAGPVAQDATPFEVVSVTIDPIRVKSKEVDAMITAAVTLRFRGYLTWLQGVVEVDRGSFILFERSYQIARGIAKFYGPTPVDPELDIELRRTFPAALVSVFVNDKLSDPRIEFQSDPADFDDTQILQIILGQNPEEVDDASLTPEQRAASAVGNVLLGRVVRDTLKIPIDVVRTHPDGYEVGKYFFDGTVLVGYRSRNSGELNKNANEGTVEWRLRRNIVVEGFYGDNSIGAADILYIIRF